MENTTTNFAGIGKRFLAFLLDSILIGGVVAFTGLGNFPNTSHHMMYGGPGNWGVYAGIGASAGLFKLALGWLYYSLMESSQYEATVGKIALGIKVTDLSGGKIDFGRATGRYFGKILSGIILGIGFLMIAFTEKKQGLHDILAKTLVVKK